MNDERPIGLKELAHYDSPDVVRVALGRFRRRLLIRGVVIPVVVAAVVFVPKIFPGTGHSPQLQFDRSRVRADIYASQLVAGPVRIQVIEGRRLDEDPLFGIRFIASTNALRPNERLSIEEGVTGFTHSCEPVGGFRPGGPPSAGVDVLTRGGNGLVEVVMNCPLDSKSVRLDIGALAGTGNTPPALGDILGGAADRGPGLPTQAECAVPLNELGVCALTKAEGSYRPLGMVTLDMEELRLERRIWRTKP
jgi:hypothetical protein